MWGRGEAGTDGLPGGHQSWYASGMDPVPTRKPVLANIFVRILLAPIALAFIIAASLAGGPREVFKALTGRK